MPAPLWPHLANATQDPSRGPAVRPWHCLTWFLIGLLLGPMLALTLLGAL